MNAHIHVLTVVTHPKCHFDNWIGYYRSNVKIKFNNKIQRKITISLASNFYIMDDLIIINKHFQNFI